MCLWFCLFDRVWLLFVLLCVVVGVGFLFVFFFSFCSRVLLRFVFVLFFVWLSVLFAFVSFSLFVCALRLLSVCLCVFSLLRAFGRCCCVVRWCLFVALF